MVRIETRNHRSRGVAEQAIEGQLRNDLLGHGGMRIAPGDRRAIDPRESAADVVDPAPRRVSAKLERGKGCRGADVPCGHLVHRRPAGIEITTGGALDVSTGEPGGYLGPMPVAADCVLVPKVLEQNEVAPEWFERLQVRRELVVFSIT